MFNCKYCGKECKNKNSLAQHEIRCKENPNRIKISNNILYIKHHKSGTKGKICISDGIKELYIKEEELNEYLKLGYYKGRSKIVNYKSTGKASTVEKENLRKEKISKTMKQNNCGGYRKGSGRGYEGWYKGIFCDSSWELAFLVYYLEHNLYIERCKEKREYIWNNEKHIYIPDFITDNGIIEIKGYKTEQSESKRLQNPDIKYLYQKDIQYCLDYTINKYGKKYWEKLYEHNIGEDPAG